VSNGGTELSVPREPYGGKMAPSDLVLHDVMTIVESIAGSNDMVPSMYIISPCIPSLNYNFRLSPSNVTTPYLFESGEGIIVRFLNVIRKIKPAQFENESLFKLTHQK